MFILGSLKRLPILVLIELFLLGVTAEVLRAKIDLKSGFSFNFK